MASRMQQPLTDMVREVDAQRENPRVAMALLKEKMNAYREVGAHVPAELMSMERDLTLDCCQLSQGR
ncbi:MAG: hypothetical protein AAFR04_03480 [Pseudomonadota bacterium]